MDLILGNPAGLWALLGIPVVLLIHLLQREARSHVVSTLFLIESLPMTGTSGRVIERVRNSLQLWLQLLAVLLLTWALIQPRWLRADSFQRVVVVLDSSVSMTAFQDRLWPALSRSLDPYRRSAAFTEWTVLESDLSAPTLYSGPELERVREAVGNRRPRLGTHDLSPSLRVAQGLAGTRGTVILVSDHEMPFLQEGIEQLAIGRPIVNCGFAGIRLDEEEGEVRWQAMLRNHSKQPARRSWWVKTEDAESERRAIELGPGETRVLRGGFPPGASQVTLQLDGDEFELDNQLPIVRPVPKAVTIDVAVDATARELVGKLRSTMTAVEDALAGFRPDLEFLSYRGPAVPGIRANAICFPRPLGEDAKAPGGLVVAEDHPFIRGLTWQGLLIDRVTPVQVGERDDVLLWQGDQPLLLLRTGSEGRQLIFLFDVQTSNAPQLPAFVLLVHRFVEAIRQEKPAAETANVEMRQRLQVAADEEGPDLVLRIGEMTGADSIPVTPARAPMLRAPDVPAHFTVRQGGTLLFRGASRFADLREADFSAAASLDEVTGDVRTVSMRNSRPDPLLPVWFLLLVGILLLTWRPARGGSA